MIAGDGTFCTARRLDGDLFCLLRIRGELAISGASSRRELVCGRSIRILTMMQSCASAAKLRAAGPFSQSASVPCSNTASRHLGSSTRQSAESQRERRVGKGMLFRAFSLPDAG